MARVDKSIIDDIIVKSSAKTSHRITTKVNSLYDERFDLNANQYNTPHTDDETKKNTIMC